MLLASLTVFNLLHIFIFLTLILFLFYIIISYIDNLYSKIVGINFNTKLKIKSILEIVIILFLLLSLLRLLIDILYNISYIYDINNIDLVRCMSTSSGSNPVVNSGQDPVRWWPSGVPQTWSIIGSSLAIYRFLPLPPRLRAIYALGSMGITIPTMIIFNGIENPNGFNRLMYSFDYRLRTGVWPHPSLVPNVVEDRYIDQVYRERTLQELQNANTINNNLVDNTSGLQGGPGSSGAGNSGSGFTSNFTGDQLPSGNDLINSMINKFFELFSHLFNPIISEGYLDDLIGQHLMFQMLILIVSISILLLIVVFLIISFFLKKKDYLMNKFDNKYIKMYLRYQFLIAKASYYIIPILIGIGLLDNIVMLYYMLTHPIPYHVIPVSLHIYVKGE